MATHDRAVDCDRLIAATGDRGEVPKLTVVPPRSHDIAGELRLVVRRAGRDPLGERHPLCRYIRSLHPPQVRLHFVLDDFSPHLGQQMRDWANDNKR